MLRKKSIIYYLFIKKYIYNAHHSKHKLLERKGILLNGSSNILIGWICYFILYFWKSPPPTNRGNWKKNNFNFWCSFNCKNWTTENRKIIKISTWWYIWNIYPVKQTLYTSNLYKSLSGNVSNLNHYNLFTMNTQSNADIT